MALTGQQEEAAALVAADTLSDDEICERVGLKSRRALWAWKQKPEFVECVKTLLAGVRQRGIALLEHRVAHLDDRHQRMQQVIRERAADETMKDVPGGKTGLIVRTYKKVGSGDDAELIPEYAVDTGLLKEMREHERQVAQELGQWLEKTSTEHRGAVTIRTITAVQPILTAPSDDGR